MTATEVRNMVGAFLIACTGALSSSLAEGGDISWRAVVIALVAGAAAVGHNLYTHKKPPSRGSVSVEPLSSRQGEGA